MKSKKIDGVTVITKHSMAVPAKSRRVRVITMLEEQLKRGTKPEKVDGKTTMGMIPLTTHDRERINNEIKTLKSRS